MPSSDIDYDKLAHERFTGTEIHEYDQITAVTQGAINYQLEQMHKLSKPDAPLKKLVTELVPDNEWTQIIAVMGAPKINLKLGVEKQTVRYMMTLESGVYRYWKGHGPSSTKETKDFKNWTLAFKVNLNWNALEDRHVPEHVKKVLQNPQDFSVHQLLVDFTTADVTQYIEKDSHIELDKSQAIEFTVYINEYLQKLAADTTSGHSTIHYLPKIKDPKKYRVPTLAPTSLNFQNLPFVVMVGDEGKEGCNDNMLVYLQTTMNKPLPRDLLAISANWVVPPSDPKKPKYDGTVGISRQRFLDEWLFPKLRKFNRQTSWIVTKAWWEGTIITDWAVEGHIGMKDDEETGKGDWVFDKKNSNADGRKYTYEFSSSKSDNHGIHVYLVSQSGMAKNKLEIPAGLNVDGKSVIKISGETTVATFVNVASVAAPSGASHKVTWTADIILDGVDHGKLKIKTNVHVNPVEEHIDETWMSNTDIGKYAAHIKKEMGTLSLDDIRQDMEKVLGGTWEFIFSGSDDFFFDKAAFNSEGDLLAQLKYQSGL